MLTKQFGSRHVRIIEQSLASQGNFVAWQGWHGNKPHLFLTRGAGRPLESPTFAISQDQLFEFCTPGTLSSLYAGDRPMDPRRCAARCAEALAALGSDSTLVELEASALLDLIQGCFDTMHRMPSFLLVEQGGDKSYIGEFEARVNGELIAEGEARV